ncbi:calcium-binding protein [Streptomyces olivochromogenes]|uniref:calcium-binding protein n=1 Tax=Streptomyces olivochromogenes TaxID=1963 RepID=UPI001F331E51|nr:calcium-binding protein [Streptomyces olivochromogenes]MCF3131013.1 calcium-binding protein [Streptomyces olivochromogenes]
MRTLTIGSALLGSLAVAALLAPGAQATEVVGNIDVGTFRITGGGGAGNDVVLGTTDSRKITVQLMAGDDSGVKVADFTLYHGSSLSKADAVLKPSEAAPVCTANGTTTVCTKHYTIDPRRDLRNALAGIWKVAIDVKANDGDYVQTDGYTSFFMKRNAKLTANASPEPVAKGRTLTVTGKLTRANWDTHDYRGYTNQRAYLEFRTPGVSYYESMGYTLTDTHGVATAKVTATADRYWRYEFRPTMTTNAVKATGDFVDVR